MSLTPSTPSAGQLGLVWDWPVRVFHWLLVLAIAVSFATHYLGIEWFDWHRRSGYVVLVLVTFRIVWGFFGPRYSRFASFVRGPRAVLEHLRDSAPPRAGHSPLAALSVLALLTLVGAQAATGLFANDEIMSSGPFYGWVTHETSNALTGWHERISNILLALIALHLLAIAWYDLARGAGLVRAMWTGHKPGAEPIVSSRGPLALVVVIALVIALALAIRAAPEASVSFF